VYSFAFYLLAPAAVVKKIKDISKNNKINNKKTKEE
jgi:hypothetical protein